jgi:hypothetical protein
MNIDRIEKILNSGVKASLVLAGGGSGAVHALLSTPGASRFIADVRIPYSPEALEDFLGEKVEHSCSPETARALAEAGQASCLSLEFGSFFIRQCLPVLRCTGRFRF